MALPATLEWGFLISKMTAWRGREVIGVVVLSVGVVGAVPKGADLLPEHMQLLEVRHSLN